jgi:hypothetical protein
LARCTSPFRWCLLVCLPFVAACSSALTGGPDSAVPTDSGSSPDSGGSPDGGTAPGSGDAGQDGGTWVPFDAGPAPIGVSVYFELDTLAQSGFFHFPWPSDLRRNADGGPDFSGFPNGNVNGLLKGLIPVAEARAGFPVTPTAYFQFDGGLSTAAFDAGVLPADPSQPVLLMDVDPSSAEQGRLFPVSASVLPGDLYTPANLLAVSPPPGILLRGHNRYAFVVRRGLGDSAGAELGVPAQMWLLESGNDPGGPNGAVAEALYASVWSLLLAHGIATTEVAAAAVFTTGDVVADLASLSTQVVARDAVAVQGLALPIDGGVHQGFCELDGTVDFPKYQTGTPPFNFSGGTFQYGADGLPAVLGTYSKVPVVLTFPQGPMPSGGYPLVVYWHGSGGDSHQAVDRGTAVKDGGVWVNTPGQGPAWVLAPYGFATACAALPLNPERVPGASDIEYLNLTNLGAFPGTFAQGLLEERELIKALQAIQIQVPAPDLASCGITLPAGQSLFFNPVHVYGQGQSMGGMYANLISAVEPQIHATVATGAGGDWQYFVLNSPQVPAGTLTILLGTTAKATWQHPTLMLLEAAWEPAEPMVFAARIGRRPLPGIPPRPIYEPVGAADSFFSEATYDAMALAYGHKEAGTIVWPTMQTALALEGLSGLVPYPVTNDLTSEAGPSYTGMVAQYVDPTGYDGHYIFTQVDGVKHQYACFLSTALTTGTATVVAPNPSGSPCQ